ncbi:MAG: GGDEF domain-containing protein, partial [Gemmataceae bacterium]
TEVANKRYLQEFLSRALGDAIRYRAPLAVMLLELDRFAGIIAQLGQLGGDFTLRAAATRLKLSIRQEDLLARYDETVFALVLPGTHRAGASTLAERLRRLIESQPLRFEEVVYGVTLSLGVAVADGQDWLTSGELLDQARAQLRAACQRGGNCVVVG